MTHPGNNINLFYVRNSNIPCVKGTPKIIYLKFKMHYNNSVLNWFINVFTCQLSERK